VGFLFGQFAVADLQGRRARAFIQEREPKGQRIYSGGFLGPFS
jgi:hypothetical protein